MATNITSANIGEILASDKPAVIDFWAEWCGPCRMMTPVIEELAKEYEGKVIIGKCNVDDNNDIAAKYSVRNIPTIVFIKNGEVVDRHVGASPKNMIEEKIKNLL